jgi:hypothetical protein
MIEQQRFFGKTGANNKQIIKQCPAWICRSAFPLVWVATDMAGFSIQTLAPVLAEDRPDQGCKSRRRRGRSKGGNNRER